MFVTIPNPARVPKATEAVLDRLYDAAKKGIKGDALALAAGMLPRQLRALQQADETVEYVVAKARAERQVELATVAYEAAVIERDANIALKLLAIEAPNDWAPPKDAQQTPFGAGGITIVIGDVTTEKKVEGTVIDQ